ncbi:Cytochrome c [Stieleria varia]|uniref:Cytochrome c n=2 Tax=Stieleria varia TaxID=2528005 RepID=A0A5C6B333_9BACT|nr:Cytochrome c [Stieleria varia]
MICATFVSFIDAADSIWVAEGLTIRQVADDDLVPDCTAITTDPVGRIVASGPGYIRVLMDGDGDGVFETSRTLVDGLNHGAQGLCFHDGDLYYTANNGIWKVADTDDDGFVDSEPSQMLEIKTGGEHEAHALRMGPDGYWYLIAGNGNRQMFELQNVESPTFPKPHDGVIWRISPDWSKREVWAHGFRNAYDFDFAPNGMIDVFDSDGERDISLPWYRPTRVFRTAQGDDAGWVSRSWKRPRYDPQMPIQLAELGRGSPTGVLRYHGNRLPDRFQNGVWVLDWTFGRVVFVGDDRSIEEVAKPIDIAGFAVTDITSTPDGRVVVSVGGRGSRGGLYLIDAARPNQSAPRQRDVIWPNTETSKHESHIGKKIRELRNRPEPTIESDAANLAMERLDADTNDAERLSALALLIESVGGLGPGAAKDPRGEEQVAAVFDGYRGVIRPRLDSNLIESATEKLCVMLKHPDASNELRHEVVRTLAVLEPESQAAWNAIAADAKEMQSPTERLHRLIALARLPVSRSDEMTDDVVQLMLQIPIEISEREMNVDRNWSERLGELLVALRRRDSLVEARLVSNPAFGHPTHLVWTKQMNPEGLEFARRKCLAVSDETIDPDVAHFIAQGDDAVPRTVVREWLKRDETRDAGWMCLASHPTESDVHELNRAVFSFNQSVREAAEKALKQLGQEIPERESASETVQAWLAKSPAILALVAMSGNVERGKTLFQVRQCANCHNGAKALGPSLTGINKRFGPADLLRATVDPSHSIPDRFRATQVLTTDGEVVIGMEIYRSVDGLTLLTADAKTVRVNTDMIELIRPASSSLMPEGLLEGLSDQDVADLVAYLSSL